ncbi:MAG: hypothetical protein K8F91_15260 [Candidatus Obscuribacterales bacterium]|nr:hypothetical protein [Candidatus Obscuribacterales bacterium]
MVFDFALEAVVDPDLVVLTGLFFFDVCLGTGFFLPGEATMVFSVGLGADFGFGLLLLTGMLAPQPGKICIFMEIPFGVIVFELLVRKFFCVRIL